MVAPFAALDRRQSHSVADNFTTAIWGRQGLQHQATDQRQAAKNLVLFLPEMPIKVLIVDDSDIMRQAIASLLERYSEIELVGQADSFHQTIQLLGKVRPHVVVLDLFMPDRTEVAVSKFRSALAGARVLAISASNNEEVRALAETVGAVKLLDKMNLWDELIPAVRECVGSGPSS
jgi:CheY-like chemotaxis protein